MLMTIIMWIVIGFLAGLLAKAVLPAGRDEPGGFIGTTVLGIVGAVIGGFIYHLVTGSTAFRTSFDIASIIWAAIGAIVVVVVARLISGRRTV